MFPVKDHNPSHKFPFITIILIIANLFVFIYSLIFPNIIFSYALIPKQINFADINTLYSFITSMYLHGGWLHLLSNMWFLWIFGDNIEATLGKIGFLIFYTISGLAAALLQYFFSPTSTIPMVGASGAIAGILGAYLVFFPKARIDTYVITFGGFLSKIQVSAGLMLIYWFAIQLLSGISTPQTIEGSGIAWWAHIGGFITGFLLANLWSKENNA